MSFANCSLEKADLFFISEVLIIPGIIEFTRIFGANSNAQNFMAESRAALDDP